MCNIEIFNIYIFKPLSNKEIWTNNYCNFQPFKRHAFVPTEMKQKIKDKTGYNIHDYFYQFSEFYFKSINMTERKRRKLSYNKSWMAASRFLKSCHKEKDDIGMNKSSDDEEFENNPDTVQNISYGLSCVNDSNDNDSDELDIPAQETLSENESHDLPNQHSNMHLDNYDQNVEWDCDSIDKHAVVSSDSEGENSLQGFEDDLATWVKNFGVCHNAVDSLLKLLRQYGHSTLPKTTRTLLKTKRNIEIDNVSGMEYVYFGVGKELLKSLKKLCSKGDIHHSSCAEVGNIT